MHIIASSFTLIAANSYRHAKTVPSKAYVIAVPVAAYRLADGSFAIEDAFSHHLKELRSQLGQHVDKIILIAPEMSRADFDKSPSLSILTAIDGIVMLPTYPENASVPDFWLRHMPRMARMLYSTISQASVVHSSLSSDTWRPMMLLVNVIAWSLTKRVMFVVDIDFRRNTWRFRHLGLWSRKNYLTNRLFHDPLRWLQIWFAVRLSRLVLLKSPELVRDFGKGRPRVKNLLNVVHSAEQVLSKSETEERLAWLYDKARPLHLAYFGRIVPYKGIDLAIEAVRLARTRGSDVRLTIIGDGPQLPDLQHQVAEARLTDAITFLPAVKYGAPLFELLSDCHACVASPLVEDTPRCAFDAMARGLPIVAFDIDYFKGLAEMSGAVTTTTWPSPEGLADAFVALDDDRSILAEQAGRAIAFARDNTQQIWMERRQAWLMEYVLNVPPKA